MTDLTAAIGMERLQRAVTLLLIQNINNAIDAQNTLWGTRDDIFFTAVGRDQDPFVCEHIASDNIYSGTIPSLIEKPNEFYPNCCVIAYIGSPISNSSDFVDCYGITIAIEIMVKSESSEEEVNARIHRTLEAANSIMVTEKHRGFPEGNDGAPIVPKISRPAMVTIGEIFIKHSGTDPNARTFYQGGSLNYLAEKFSPY